MTTTGQGCEGTLLMQTSCLKSKNLWQRLRWCFQEDHSRQHCAAGGVPEGAWVADFGAAELGKAAVVNGDKSYMSTLSSS
jgi:hypothetical protein